MSVGQDFKYGWDKLIDTIGTNFSIERQNGSIDSAKLHFTSASNDDLAIINSLGADARIAQSKAESNIARYDILTSPTGRKYTVEASHEVMVQDILIGYRIYMI